MDPDTEIEVDSAPFFRIYKSGRVERFPDFTPPSVDPDTGVTSKDTVIDPETGVSARLYLPKLSDGDASTKKLPVLVYYHGGGFIVGSAFSSLVHNYLNSIVAKANVIAVSVEYRLAPEHPIPAAYDDSWLAIQWTSSHVDDWLARHADLGRLFLSGDSAGANIAHNIAMRAGAEKLKQDVRVTGVVLLHPYFLGPERTESVMMDLATSAKLEALWKRVCPSSTVDYGHCIDPLVEGAPSLSRLGCGRVLVCVGERDTLRDRGRAYCEALRGSGWGGEVELWESPGKGHVFHVWEPGCEEALALLEKVSSFLNH